MYFVHACIYIYIYAYMRIYSIRVLDYKHLCLLFNIVKDANIVLHHYLYVSVKHSTLLLYIN